MSSQTLEMNDSITKNLNTQSLKIYLVKRKFISIIFLTGYMLMKKLREQQD